MTNNEYLNKTCNENIEPHLQAFQIITAELMVEYPDFNFDYWDARYLGMIDWLNEEKPEKEVV